MKPFVMLVLFICFCNLYALTAPTNVRASAIGHDAFTLRWDTVDGATGYDVEVMEDVEQFFVDFEEPSSLDGWTVNNAERVYSTTVTAGYKSYGLLKLMRSNSYAITPVLSSPRNLSFWICRSAHLTAYLTVTIEYSSNQESWQQIGELKVVNGAGNPTTTYQQFSYDLNLSGDVWIKFSYTTTSGCTIRLDNIMVQERGQEVAEANLDYHATRVSGLSPNTDYLYRVRATADLQAGPFSEWQSITTLAEAPANAAYGSAIGDNPAIIDLPQIGTYAPQSIEISPSESADADYMIEVGIEAGGISYTVFSDSGAALNGDYLIMHPGYNATSIDASMGRLSIIELGNGFTSFNIDGFISKGTLHIFLALDETLPVQMGRMMLVPVGVNGVNLQWFSYSESELAGYYVLRSESNDLNQAQYVSPLIEATNTGSTAHYMFHDTEVSENCYYWLEARDYSGAAEYFGPEYYEKQIPGNDIPPILQNTLQAIYPNPFNPSTTISYSLAEPQAVSIKIYDARGRLVHRHDEATKSAGRYQYIWNAEHTASGVYFLKLGIGERSFERKIVLLK